MTSNTDGSQPFHPFVFGAPKNLECVGGDDGALPQNDSNSSCCKVAVIFVHAKMFKLKGLRDVRGVHNSQTLSAIYYKLLIVLVAGGGIEPPTLGL